MFSSIWYDVKRQFNYGNTLTRIILVNILVFVAINIFRFIMFLVEGATPPAIYQNLIEFLSISSNWQHNLTHPWTFITYMFLHESIWHIFWNMLLLYWFGRIVGDLLGDRRVLPIYLLGGFAGALVYFVLANLNTPWHFGYYALGASAAVTAMLMVAGKTASEYAISLLFIGAVKLKYIVAFFIFMDVVAISWDFNSGGAFAHLGGAAMGYLIASRLQQGSDWTAPVNNLLNAITRFFNNLFSQAPRQPKMTYKSAKTTKHQAARDNRQANNPSDTSELSHQEKLDAILDKIKQMGYNSLSASEKEFLFNASKK